MYEQAGKTNENKSRAVAYYVSQNKRNEKQCFGLNDNRPERIVQRKLMELVNDGDSSAYTTQKKTINPAIPNLFQKKPKTLVDYHPKEITACNALEVDGHRSKYSQQLGSQDSMEDTIQRSTIIQMVQYNNIETKYDELITKHTLVEALVHSQALDIFFDEEEGTYEEKKAKHAEDSTVRLELQALEKLLHWETGNEAPDREKLEGVSNNEIADIKKVTDIPTDDYKGISELELDLPMRMDSLIKVLGDNAGSGATFKSYVDTLLQKYNEIYDDVKPAMEEMGAETKENKWQMGVKALGADAHGGLGPMHIKLINPVEGKIDEFIYKPRPGNIDTLVMDMFKKLNEVERVGKPRLPVYEQRLTEKGFLLSEVVKGKTALNTTGNLDNVIGDLGSYVHRLGWTAEDVEKVEKQLIYLDVVAKKIGLTDLHNDNLIVNPETKEVVPVDLESIIKPTAEGISTGLYGDNPSPAQGTPLNAEEQKILTDTSGKIAFAQYRVVPLATSRFNEWLENPELTDQSILNELRESLGSKWGIRMDTEAMETYLIECKQSKIIPYFLHKDRKLYSGSNNQVGELNE